jgi:hypothetical protein
LVACASLVSTNQAWPLTACATVSSS